jgi:hypothetical protein
MDASALDYPILTETLKKYEEKERSVSANFLNWFLENIYRLDAVEADDAICDEYNDKGIDGVYVDHNSEEIHLFQAKISQKTGRTIGDTALKEFSGSLDQFITPEAIQKILEGNANADLKKSLIRNDIKSLIDKGYQLTGIFISNSQKDSNTIQYENINEKIRIFCAETIAENFIEFDADEGVTGSFDFDTSYAGVIDLTVDTQARIYLLPVKASELVQLEGISDGVLFSQNVRYSLGDTPVNKAISKSIADGAEHKQFCLYHNGITLICKNANFDTDSEKLTVTDYVVVNGAQSLSTFFHNSEKLTDDLRIFAKIISLESEPLSRKITINSNNQNAIKPRDLRSNHDLMLRLKAEFEQNNDQYEFEIKRGQSASEGKLVITNEDAGKILLAFDLHEPYSCHQIYRVFDDKYAQIFGRPEVTSSRIIFLQELYNCVVSSLDNLEYKPMARYTLTRFLLVDVLGHIIRLFNEGKDFLSNTLSMNDPAIREEIIKTCDEILAGLIVDLNYEVNERIDDFDYKKDFKSPESIRDWRETLIRSYEKDFRRDKASGFGLELTKEQ